MANPEVIDISHWQPEPSFAKVKAGGTVGVIFKATESTGYVDPTFKSRASLAMSEGLLISTYHFLRPGNYEQQMAHYLKTVDPVRGERVVLDHEDPKVSLADLEQCVRHLLADSRGLQVTIYSGHLIKEQLGTQDNPFLAANTSLWIAQYTSAAAPNWPKQVWPAWSLWQYSQTESVSGISGNVDGNRFNGDDEQLRKWWGPATAEPVPEPEAPTHTEVVLQMAPGSTMTFNGKIIEF